MPARRAAAALTVAAVAFAGCGSAGEDSAEDFQGAQRDVAQAVEDLEDAGRRADGEEVCTAIFTERLAKQVATASKEPCQDALDSAIDDADGYDLVVERVRVDGTRATATVRNEAGDDERTTDLGLLRVGQAWRVDSLGR